MQVETFECEETKSETMEHTDEAIRLIEELGLTAQQELISPDKTERTPYRVMTGDEEFAYRTLCPKETRIERYRDEPIPLRVLQVAAHAKSLGIFSEMIIWHKDSASIKDPVLVGIGKAEPSYENNWRGTAIYILARWGEVLDEWPAVLKSAMAKWRETCREKLAKIAQQASNSLSLLDSKGVNFAMQNRNGPVFDWD